jgi:CcmD family protein
MTEIVPIDNMEYLVAAYSAIWIVIAFYLLVLLRRNRRLQKEVEQLEARVTALQGESGQGTRE